MKLTWRQAGQRILKPTQQQPAERRRPTATSRAATSGATDFEIGPAATTRAATGGATDFESGPAAASRAATSGATDFEIGPAAASRAAMGGVELGNGF